MSTQAQTQSNPRLLVFVPEFPRVTETFIQREIAKLIDLDNFNVTVFALQRASGKFLPGVDAHTVYESLTPLAFVKAMFWVVPRGRLLLSAWRAYKADPDFSEVAGMGRVYFFLKAVGYAYLFSKHSPDHIHANFMSWSSTMAWLASVLLEIPYSISAHAKDVMVEGEFFELKGKTAKFTTICNRYAHDFCLQRMHSVPSAQVIMQYHGIDPDTSFSGIRPVERSSRFFVSNVGSRLVEKKGQRYLISAMALLRDWGIDAELHIAGPGPLYDVLQDQIAKLHLTDSVFIHGEGNGIPFEKVVAFLKACDVVVQSNINLDSGDADGIPTLVIESALLSKPIISTDAGSIPELIVDGQTGLVVPQKDVSALATAIARVYVALREDRPKRLPSEVIQLIESDPIDPIALGSSAKSRALENFDLTKNVRALEKLLLS